MCKTSDDGSYNNTVCFPKTEMGTAMAECFHDIGCEVGAGGSWSWRKKALHLQWRAEGQNESAVMASHITRLQEAFVGDHADFDAGAAAMGVQPLPSSFDTLANALDRTFQN